jgi:2-dehydropantoate 2-reductase
VNATIQAEEAGPCDLVIIATKAMDTEAAVENARPMIGPQTLVLTIQNGLGNAERLERLIGPENLLVGIAGGFGASIVKPGHVHHAGWALIHLAEGKGGVSERLNRVAAVWEAAGFNVAVVEDAQQMIWGKLLLNIAFSATCTVTGLRVGQVLNNPSAWSIAESCIQEASAVAEAKQITLPYQNPVAWVRGLGSKISDACPSMLQDLEAGRPSEIESLNGAVVREAEALGVAAPVNRVMTILVRAMEQRRQLLGRAYGVV